MVCKIGLSAQDSKPYWRPQVVPPKGAPNVLLIMTDDAGYGVSGTFGGVIPTPNLDRIAKMGLRYTQVHSTALCSPTRAALITGRNHHAVGFGVIAEQSTGYPGYNSIIGPDNATVGNILKMNGYATSWFGKNHNTPSYQINAGGPVRPMAERHGFRIFLRFHGRRNRPVDAVSVPQPHPDFPVARASPATTSPPAWRTTPSSTSGRSTRRLPTSRSSSTTCPAALTRRTSPRPNGSPSSRASSTWAGTRCAIRFSPIRSVSASFRPIRS